MKTSRETDSAERHGRHDADEKVFTVIARAGGEVICIGYIYKPSRQQMDSVVAAVKEPGPRVPGLNVSQFYEFAVERSLREYQEAPEAFLRNLRESIWGGVFSADPLDFLGSPSSFSERQANR